MCPLLTNNLPVANDNQNDGIPVLRSPPSIFPYSFPVQIFALCVSRPGGGEPGVGDLPGVVPEQCVRVDTWLHM
jgi:hypothetical protein